MDDVMWKGDSNLCNSIVEEVNSTTCFEIQPLPTVKVDFDDSIDLSIVKVSIPDNKVREWTLIKEGIRIGVLASERSTLKEVVDKQETLEKKTTSKG